MIHKIAEWIAFGLFLIATSGDAGWKFVNTLVQIVTWIDNLMGNILGLPYSEFWVIALTVIGFVFGIPIWWIAISQHKIAKK
jgi:hypothetical protein